MCLIKRTSLMIVFSMRFYLFGDTESFGLEVHTLPRVSPVDFSQF